MISKALLLLPLFALAASAQAQLSVYGEATVSRLNGVQSSPVLTTSSSNYRDYVNPLGFTGGAFYDFRNAGPVRLGVDLRGSYLTTNRGALVAANGAGAKIGSGLAGIRATFHTPYLPLKPYIQGSAGIGRSNYGILGPAGLPSASGTGLVNNFEYHVYGGLDLDILPALAIRVFELGYGGLDPFGNNAHNYPLKSISVGVVFHLPTL